MFSEIEIQLGLAAGIMLFSVYCIGKSTFWNPREMTVNQIAIANAGIYFGFGPFASYAVGGGTLSDERMANIVAAYAVVALFIVGLASIPWVLRLAIPNYKQVTIWEILSVALDLTWFPVLALFLTTWGLRFFIATNYGIFFYATATVERIRSMPYSVVVLQNIMEFLGISSFLWASLRIWKPRNGLTFWIALFIVSMSFLWAIMQGRRPLFIHALFFFFSYLAVSNMVRVRQILFAAIFFATILFVGFPFLLRLRMAHDLLGSEEDAVGHAYRATMGASRISSQELNSFYRDNMSERPLIIRFVCKILASQESLQPMHGRALLNSFIWVIPAVIYKDKGNIYMTEQCIQSYFYHPLTDTSITWAATGCADFGVPGGFIIGVLLAVIILIIEQCTRNALARYPIAAISAIGTLLVTLSNVESEPLDVFMLIRASIIIYLIARGLRAFGLTETSYMEPHTFDGGDPESLELIDAGSLV